MGKMNELSLAIDELHRCGEALISVADSLRELFSEGDEANDVQVVAKAAPAPTVTLEQVRAILTEKSRIGYTTQVRELLSRYGATKLSGVDPSEYAALLADAEVLGNG
jgi:hypothetical protein